jgi:hypothetical protein
MDIAGDWRSHVIRKETVAAFIDTSEDYNRHLERGAITFKTDYKFGKLILPNKRSKIKSVHAWECLLVSVLRWIKVHRSKYGERSYISVHSCPYNVYLKNFLCTNLILLIYNPKRTTWTPRVLKMEVHKGHIKGLKSKKVLELTWQCFHKPLSP